MVNVTKYGTGKCILCQRELDGVVCEFRDGTLKGHLCMRHFHNAMKARSENGDERAKTEAPEDNRSR